MRALTNQEIMDEAKLVIDVETFKEKITYLSDRGVHDSIVKFLKRNPELMECPDECKEFGYTYPSMKAWENLSIIATEGKFWDREDMLTKITTVCLGITCGILFPKFYSQEWLKKE